MAQRKPLTAARAQQRPGLRRRSAMQGRPVSQDPLPRALCKKARVQLALRLQLEYAHVLLRKNDYERAAQEAEAAGQNLSGAGQAAALAVQGTAHREIGMAVPSNGNSVKGAQFLRSADSAMAQVLETHPDLASMGALAARRAAITVQLRARSELNCGNITPLFFT